METVTDLKYFARLAACAIAILTLPGPAPAAERAAEPLAIELVARSPEQMSAFYEARGFPQAMIRPLAEACFFTVRIHNRSSEVIWLELANWRFSAQGKPVHRYHRNEWLSRWQAMQMPLASQSTFRWTLLPESLDFLPGEEEGGNIILERTSEPITLQAEFVSGQDKRGRLIRVRYENLLCAKDAP